MGARGEIEQRGFTAVGIAHQRYVDDMAPALHFLVQLQGVRVVIHDACLVFWSFTRHRGFSFCHHFYHIRLAMPQRHLVAHYLIFHGVLQRGVEQHLRSLSFYKTHFNDALAKATMASHLDDDTALARFQFR